MALTEAAAVSLLSFRPLLGRQGVPDAYRGVAGAGDQPRAIRAPGHGMDVSLMAAQLGHFLVRRQVPQADGVIRTRGRQARAVRAEGHLVDVAAVLEGRGDRLEGGGIP